MHQCAYCGHEFPSCKSEAILIIRKGKKNYGAVKNAGKT